MFSVVLAVFEAVCRNETSLSASIYLPSKRRFPQCFTKLFPLPDKTSVSRTSLAATTTNDLFDESRPLLLATPGSATCIVGPIPEKWSRPKMFRSDIGTFHRIVARVSAVILRNSTFSYITARRVGILIDDQ
jgi:hypothetical protein